MQAVIDVIQFFIDNTYYFSLLFSLLVVLFQRKKPTSTILWVMIIMLFNWAGFFLYLMIGADFKKSKRFKNKDFGELKYQNLADKQLENLDSGLVSVLNEDYIKYESLIRLNLIDADAFLTFENKVDLYKDGTIKFKNLIEDIRNAKKSIYLEYYIFKPDNIGITLIEELTKKAKEGLEVKLLVDGIGGRRIKKEHIEEYENAGGKFAVFFPLMASFVIFRLNYRNHRKLAVIDDKIGYVGGFNVGDEYMNISDFGFWNDAHIRIVGNGTTALLWRFYLDWKYAAKEIIKLPEMNSTYESHEEGAGIQIISSGPDSIWPSNKDAFIKMINSAKEILYIQTPYFIPDASVYDSIRLAALSGVDVRIMIPKKRDHPFVHWAGLSYLGELLECDVKVYVYDNGFLHSKVMVVDDFVSTVGTTNMDIRSFELNFEVNAVIYDKSINEQLREKFLDDISSSIELDIITYMKRGVFTKIRESISRLFSPLL